MTTPKFASRALGVLSLLGAVAPSVAAADNILYCNDYVLGTDHMATALSTLSSVHTTTSTTSITTCESYISSGGYDLVILAIQNQTYSTPNFVSYVNAGGAAILQDWTRDSTRGSAIGVGYGSTNSASMTVTSSDLSSGLSSTSVGFTNPGWGIYTMGMSTGYISGATFASGEVAIALTNSGNAIVNGFLTDTITSAADAEQLYINEIEYLLGSCDEDGDGFDATGACGGSDCDDTDASVYPGAPEYCNGIDDDCDSTIDEDTAVDASTWYEDSDSDGYGNPSVTDVECYAPSGYVADNTDCDDTVSSTYPGAPEYCNGVDDDCDSTIDEDTAVDAVTWYRDADSDGYGDPTATDIECYVPSGYVADNTDCDDSRAATYPGADEYCNGIDDDCDSTIDEDTALDAVTWYADTDSDGYGDASVTDVECSAPSGYVSDATDCDDTRAATYPGAPEYCNGIDDDCDSTIDEDTAVDATTWYADSDGDGYGDAATSDTECSAPSGYVADNTDCDDTVATTYPGADEYCNGVDDDCDTDIDEDTAVDAVEWYADSDGDGYGDATVTDTECSAPSGFVADDTDCDDARAATYPGADEYCNGIDDDCDTVVDEDDALDAVEWYRDADEDGYGDATISDTECYEPSGYVADDQDCDDTNPDIYPGAPETAYDGVDDDCDGEDLCDSDGDTYNAEECGGDDCDDTDPDISPEAFETWYDGIDQDCDDADDYDADGDGHTSASYEGDDCDDADATVYPGAPDEPYDGVVSDCDGADEYDADGDGHDSSEYGGDDCDDNNSDVGPDASETWYDGIDDNCDGNDDDQDEDGYGVEDDCDDLDASVYPGNGELGDDCEPLDAELDTGGLSEDALGIATGGGGMKGCATTKTAGLFGFLGLSLLGLRRRRQD